MNRLIVIGTPARVREFRDTMRRVLHRQTGKHAWDELVPFSLQALVRLIGARQPDSYAEPYSISVWPIRRMSPRRAEIRYQFETRNLEIAPLLKRLSRRMPALTFRLIIHCLDDDSPYSFEMKAGRSRKRSFSDAAREEYWELARRKFKLEDDDVYMDDDAEYFVEERLRQDILNAWEKPELRRRLDWWNRPTCRDLEDKMLLSVAEANEAMEADSRRSRGRG